MSAGRRRSIGGRTGAPGTLVVMSVRRVRAGLGAAVTVAALGLTGCSGGSDAVDPTNGGQFHYVGATKNGTLIPAASRKVAGNATAALLDGSKRFSLTAERGKVVVLNFWATWCGPCAVETPQLDRLYRKVKAPDMQFVGLAVKDTSKSAVRSFVHDNAISFPIAYDETAKSALQLGRLPLTGLPDTVVVDKQGRVAAVYVGPVTPGDLQPVLTTLAAET